MRCLTRDLHLLTENTAQEEKSNVCFDGVWVGRGEMRGTAFTFNDGPRVHVRFPGPQELELLLHGEKHHGVLQKDGTLKWDDGDVWRRGAESVTSRFGLGLHSRVRLACACGDAGKVGTVVGFTSEHVEVKFDLRIVRCSSWDLQPWEESTVRADNKVAASGEKPRTWIDVVRREAVPAHASSSVQALPKTAEAKQCKAAPASKQATTSLSAVPAQRQVKVERPAAFRSASSKAAARPSAPSRSSVESAAAMATAAPKYVDATWYTGVVKWWRGSWGLLKCDALHERFPEQDVFLHKTDCSAGPPRQWDRMEFRLVVDGGNPKAVRARPEGAGDAKKMSYED